MKGALVLAALLAAPALDACSHPGRAAEVPVPLLAGVDPDVVEACNAARDAVVREPGSAEAWGHLGDRYFVHEFLPEAARCYAKAAELDPSRYVWAYRLGWSHVNDDPAAAAKAFESCLAALEDYAPAHEIYANVLVRLGREDEARAEYARASELDPTSAHAEAGLGLIALARGELEEARTHLEAALARDEKHVEAHVGLAQVYQALGQENRARRHAELSRTLPPTTKREDFLGTPSPPPAGARARTRFAKQLEKQGHADEAIEQYRIALRGNPDFYAARHGLAQLLAGQGKLDEAAELLREGQRLNPGSAQVREDLARLLGTAPAAEGDDSED